MDGLAPSTPAGFRNGGPSVGAPGPVVGICRDLPRVGFFGIAPAVSRLCPDTLLRIILYRATRTHTRSASLSSPPLPFCGDSRGEYSEAVRAAFSFANILAASAYVLAIIHSGRSPYWYVISVLVLLVVLFLLLVLLVSVSGFVVLVLFSDFVV